jgi:hypothetical protein
MNNKRNTNLVYERIKNTNPKAYRTVKKSNRVQQICLRLENEINKEPKRFNHDIKISNASIKFDNSNKVINPHLKIRVVNEENLNERLSSLSSASNKLNLIKRRLNSLLKIQQKSSLLESKFYEELYLLECKYNKLDKPLRDLRKSIINGSYEPNDFECKLDEKITSELESENEICRDLIALNIQSNFDSNSSSLIKGIPEFWLNVFKYIQKISKMIEPHDEPILKHLVDLDIELSDKKPYNFKLKFYFSPNDYFEESILTKSYEFKIDYNSSDPYFLQSPQIQCSKGCKITWKTEINCETDSFFNFFKNCSFNNKNPTNDEELELAFDYEIGYTFREKAISKGILYYIGFIKDDCEDEISDADSNNEDEILSNDQQV